MKRNVCYTMVLCIIIFMTSFAKADERLRVVVVDLKAQGVPNTKAMIISNMLRNDLVNDGRFIVIERNQMESILKEQGFQQTGCTDQACVVEMGRLLSANKMIVGEVLGADNTLYITVRVVDVEKGVIDFAEKEIAPFDEQLDQVTARLTSKLSDKIQAGSNKQKMTIDKIIPSDDTKPQKPIEKEFIKKREEIAEYTFIMKGLLLEYAMLMPQAAEFKECYGPMQGGGLGYIYMFNNYIGIRAQGIVNTGSAKDADAKILFVNYSGGIISGYPLFSFTYPYIGIMGKGIWLKESSNTNSATFTGYGVEMLGGIAFKTFYNIGLFVEYVYSYGKLMDKAGSNVTSGILQAGVTIHL